MDQAASDYVLAVRVLHTGSIIMTHAVGHARAVAASYPALRSSCMSSPLSPSSGANPRGGRVRCYSADREAGTPRVPWWSCASGTQERSFSYNTFCPTPQHRKTSKREGIGTCNEDRMLVRYYASTQS